MASCRSRRCDRTGAARFIGDSREERVSRRCEADQTTVAPRDSTETICSCWMLLATKSRVARRATLALDAENAAIYTWPSRDGGATSSSPLRYTARMPNGAQLDPDEVALLEELALEAARAYDHVEAVRVREQYAHFATKEIPQTT